MAGWGSVDGRPSRNPHMTTHPATMIPSSGFRPSMFQVIHVEGLSQLPKILNDLPDEEVQRMQSALAKAHPLFSYRSVSDDTSVRCISSGSGFWAWVCQGQRAAS